MMSLALSAPGKVLIAGGYLVLDRKYSGIVVSTSSRFYTVIREHTDASSHSLIQVRSPQFISAEWEAIACVEDGHILLKDTDSTKALSKNKFVFLAIQKVLQLVLEMKGNAALESILKNGLNITIVGDNDFYSQRDQLASRGLPSTLDSLKKLPAFSPTNVTLKDVHKTGLGSSAALITSLVTALLVHFSVVSPQSLSQDSNGGRSFAHNVAQYVHCLAQGKVGSGFDVSSAIFGSHVYTRFDPAVLEQLMKEMDPPVPLLPSLSPSNLEWNHIVESFRMPPRMRLMLADVDAGSDTPSLVGKVLQWRRTKQMEADKLWDDLSLLNRELASVLTTLSEQQIADPKTYDIILSAASTLQISECKLPGTTAAGKDIASRLVQARTVAEDIRKYMRQMGSLSGVPIEPPEQTRLLDACLAQPGVVAGGVPGAGGYDAIWLLVIEPLSSADSTPVGAVEGIWSSWKELDVSPLSAVESRERGVRLERLDAIPGLAEVLK